MAEVIMNHRAGDIFIAYSAGSRPAEQIHPLAYQELTNLGYDMTGKHPKSMEEYYGVDFDFIITLCDSMKETCPVFPGQPIYAHWGMPDPAEFEGSDDAKLRIFKKTILEITFRINLLLNLPIEKLDRLALETKVKEIGKSVLY
jgi:arsenate reductase